MVTITATVATQIVRNMPAHCKCMHGADDHGVADAAEFVAYGAGVGLEAFDTIPRRRSQHFCCEPPGAILIGGSFRV